MPLSPPATLRRDESQTVFASQCPPYYGFDTKMMKVCILSGRPHRPSHPPGSSDPPKTRWSPNSCRADNGGHRGNNRDTFTNCCCRPQSSTAPHPTYSAALRISTPFLAINANADGNTGTILPAHPDPRCHPFRPNGPRLTTVPTSTPHTSVSAITCWAWVSLA